MSLICLHLYSWEMFTNHVSSCKVNNFEQQFHVFLSVSQSKKNNSCTYLFSLIFMLSSKTLYSGPIHNQKISISNPVPICSLLVEKRTFPAKVQKQAWRNLNEKINCRASDIIGSITCLQGKLGDWNLIHRTHGLKNK